jgi:predicted methyltransferase
MRLVGAGYVQESQVMTTLVYRQAALVLTLMVFVAGPVLAAFDAKTAAAVDAAISAEHRSTENKARDQYRHPEETLEFLGFRSDMTVLEIWPGGGWYTQILASAVKDEGKLYAVQYDVNGPFGFQRRLFGEFLSMFAETPDIYGNVTITFMDLPYQLDVAPNEIADMAVTFRSVHNWVETFFGGGKFAVLPFQAMYDALKPGGILGVVDHHWPDPATEDPTSQNGYISKERTIELAEAAGFRFVGESDILRNPKDTRDHPMGVWSLPPSLAGDEQDKEKYLAIGESDRFLLKFEKPAK